MFADSSGKFQVKVLFNLSNGPEGRKAMLSQFIFSELFSGDPVDLMFVRREITDTLSFRFEAKSFAKKKTLD